jgi:beta-lactamase superfamily II metal-dependent hydrolase
LPNQNLTSPPAVDQLEITAFGPGVGECILVHCGNNNWICLDCATDKGRTWPLSYLSEFGFAPADCVRLIVATHWHRDHVQGISNLVETCVRAKFVCSSAWRADEFEQLVARFSVADLTMRRPPLGEVRRVFEVLMSREERNDANYQPPNYANAHETLDRFNVGGLAATITALSPSAQDRVNALRAFAGYFVPVDQSATGLSPIEQNHASVVILIEIEGVAILLGADLETTTSQHTGWNAVVASRIRPQVASQVFKIPHHGSSTSHSDELWREMLVPKPIAILTPYTPSGVPNEGEIEWLKQREAMVFATGVPQRATVRRERDVAKNMRAVTTSLRSFRLQDEPGIVRLRKKLDDGRAGHRSCLVLRCRLRAYKG